MLNLFKSGKAHLGLDLSEGSLKFVELDRAAEKGVVRAYSSADIPKEIFSSEKISNSKLLRETIREALNHPKFGKITTPYVVASIPETKSFVRVIQIPRMSPAEAGEAIKWEAEAYIPISISQVYLDWLILDEAAPDGKMTVLISAAPKDYVDAFVEILKTAGLRPAALEVESQATVRSIAGGMKDVVLIADIDAVRTSLIIYARGVLEYTFSLPIGGNSFTDNIAKYFETDLGKAEAIKRKVGLLGAGREGQKIRKALTSILDSIISEIKNTIRFYEEHSDPEARVQKIFLVGGGARLKHLPSFLQERFNEQDTVHPIRSLKGLKVELGNPWQAFLRKGQTPPFSREESLGYATAIGLALREIKYL